MESALCSSELYSHEGKLLEEHLVNVAEMAVQNLKQASEDIFKSCGKQVLEKLVT